MLEEVEKVPTLSTSAFSLSTVDITKKNISRHNHKQIFKIISPPALGTLVHKDLQRLQGSLPTRLSISKGFAYNLGPNSGR